MIGALQRARAVTFPAGYGFVGGEIWSDASETGCCGGTGGGSGGLGGYCDSCKPDWTSIVGGVNSLVTTPWPDCSFGAGQTPWTFSGAGPGTWVSDQVRLNPGAVLPGLGAGSVWPAADPGAAYTEHLSWVLTCANGDYYLTPYCNPAGGTPKAVGPTVAPVPRSQSPQQSCDPLFLMFEVTLTCGVCVAALDGGPITLVFMIAQSGVLAP